MTYEFEGKTEKEAIENAANELGLGQDQFDVEILESQKNSLFKKGYVKICVHTLDDKSPEQENERDYRTKKGGYYDESGDGEGRNESERFPKKDFSASGTDGFYDEPYRKKTTDHPEPQDEFEEKIVSFVKTIIEKMGYDAEVTIGYREEAKLGLNLSSSSSSILIGKKGSHLDALQLLANIYATKLGKADICVIIDVENYRLRREESLVRLAYNISDKVRETHRPVLLEPMNSYERRLIHTTINDMGDVATKSEGEGLYKRVRVFYNGRGRY